MSVILQVVPALPLPRRLRFFDYRVEDASTVQPGQRIRIPFRQRMVFGIIWRVIDQSAIDPGRVRTIAPPEPEPQLLTDEQRSFAEWVADQYGVSLSLIVKSLLSRPWPNAAAWQAVPETGEETLSIPPFPSLPPGQLSVGFYVRQHGRIEWYRRLFASPHTRPLIVIVPELAGLSGLAPLAPRSVAVHSGQTRVEQRQTANELPTAKVILGTRSLLLYPLPAPSLLVVDDEDNEQHKQRDLQPRVASLTLALERVRRWHVPLIAIATAPSLASYAAATPGRLHRIDDATRPRLSLVDRARSRPTAANQGFLHTLHGWRSLGQRVFLFLNRRGLSRLVACRDCGWLARCQQCGSALTQDPQQLRCPTDGAIRPPYDRCPECGGATLDSALPGTIGLERSLHKAFPDAVVRIDRDQTAPALLERPILIGTERALPLLGAFRPDQALILDFDRAFASPSARALERAWQLLSRVAATDSLQGMTIQTRYGRHPLLRHFAHGDVLAFLAEELATRVQYGLPPAKPLIAFDAASKGEADIVALKNWLTAGGLDPAMLRGPVQTPVGRRSNLRYLYPLPSPNALTPSQLTQLPESWIIDPEPLL